MMFGMAGMQAYLQEGSCQRRGHRLVTTETVCDTIVPVLVWFDLPLSC